MNGKIRRHAVVRPPGRSFSRAISSSDTIIDVALAQRQHAEYCQALAAAGVAVEALPAAERYPDSCFMQDAALVVAGTAVLARPGAASRLGEKQLVAPILRQRFPLVEIVAPATLEGGDVLVLPGKVCVGRSARTNGAGVEQLRQALAPRPVEEIPVTGLLHLLSGATYLGYNMVLAIGRMAQLPQLAGFDVLVAPDDEAYACNALGLGDCVIVPAGFPKTEALLSAHGFTVLPTPVSEFAKADGGVTCLSLVYEEPAS